MAATLLDINYRKFEFILEPAKRSELIELAKAYIIEFYEKNLRLYELFIGGEKKNTKRCLLEVDLNVLSNNKAKSLNQNSQTVRSQKGSQKSFVFLAATKISLSFIKPDSKINFLYNSYFGSFRMFIQQRINFAKKIIY